MLVFSLKVLILPNTFKCYKIQDAIETFTKFDIFQGEDNYAFEMELGEAPKSPWRYPHLMFRESRKHKTVSFKKSGSFWLLLLIILLLLLYYSFNAFLIVKSYVFGLTILKCTR